MTDKELWDWLLGYIKQQETFGVHTPTIEVHQRVLKVTEQNSGIIWSGNESPTNYCAFHMYKEQTCIIFQYYKCMEDYRLMYGAKESYITQNKSILQVPYIKPKCLRFL